MLKQRDINWKTSQTSTSTIEVVPCLGSAGVIWSHNPRIFVRIYGVYAPWKDGFERIVLPAFGESHAYCSRGFNQFGGQRSWTYVLHVNKSISDVVNWERWEPGHVLKKPSYFPSFGTGDRCYNGLGHYWEQRFLLSGDWCRYLLTGRDCRDWTGQEDFEVCEGRSAAFFVPISGSEILFLLVVSNSNIYVLYEITEKKIVVKLLAREEVQAPASSIFVEYGYLQRE